MSKNYHIKRFFQDDSIGSCSHSISCE